MKTTIIALVAGLIGGMFFSTLHTYLYSRPVAVIRLNEIVSDHLEVFGQKELSEEEREKLSNRFSSALEKAISDVAEREKVTLFVAPAVLTSVPDYTDVVLDEIRAGMDE